MNDSKLLKISCFYDKYKNNRLYKPKKEDIFNKIITETIFCKTDHGPFNPSNSVMLKKSSIHGNGVFATRNIRKGEILTLYPAHYIFTKSDEEKYLTSQTAASRQLKCSDEIKKSYSTMLNDYYMIVGDPRIHNKSGFIGHMCNDGQTHNLTEYNKETEDEYKINTPKTCNAAIECRPFESLFIHDPSEGRTYNNTLSMFIMAIRDIKEGEEILVPYGFHYWIQYNRRKNNE